MKDYVVKGNVVEITLDNDKVVKCSNAWVEKTMELLKTSAEDVMLMWLEDNGYIVNEEQEALDKQAKANKVKLVAKEEKPKAKTPKERVQKENPTKELIIAKVAEMLQNLQVDNLNIENKAKLITFTLNGNDFKLDLVQKRAKKA